MPSIASISNYFLFKNISLETQILDKHLHGFLRFDGFSERNKQSADYNNHQGFRLCRLSRFAFWRDRIGGLLNFYFFYSLFLQLPCLKFSRRTKPALLRPGNILIDIKEINASIHPTTRAVLRHAYTYYLVFYGL